LLAGGSVKLLIVTVAPFRLKVCADAGTHGAPARTDAAADQTNRRAERRKPVEARRAEMPGRNKIINNFLPKIKFLASSFYRDRMQWQRFLS